VSKRSKKYISLYRRLQINFGFHVDIVEKGMRYFWSMPEVTPIDVKGLSQIEGAFEPLFDIGKDFVDTFKPYRVGRQAGRDALQPFFGLFNVFKGIFYLVAFIPLLIVNLFRAAFEEYEIILAPSRPTDYRNIKQNQVILFLNDDGDWVYETATHPYQVEDALLPLNNEQLESINRLGVSGKVSSEEIKSVILSHTVNLGHTAFGPKWGKKGSRLRAAGQIMLETASWFVDAILSIFRGITQIATFLLTWLVKMPIRGAITAYYYFNSDLKKRKFLLAEQNPGIQHRVQEMLDCLNEIDLDKPNAKYKLVIRPLLTLVSTDEIMELQPQKDHFYIAFQPDGSLLYTVR